MNLLDYEEYQRLDLEMVTEIRRAYLQQKHNARSRGIPWRLDFT